MVNFMCNLTRLRLLVVWSNTSQAVGIKVCVDVINIYSHLTLSELHSIMWTGLIQSAEDLKSKVGFPKDKGFLPAE